MKLGKKLAHRRSLERLEALVALAAMLRKRDLGSTATAVTVFEYEDGMGVIGGFCATIGTAMRKAGLR